MAGLPDRRMDCRTAASFEQPGIGFALQFRDAAADCRLPNPRFLGGKGEARVAYCGVERAKGSHPGPGSVGTVRHGTFSVGWRADLRCARSEPWLSIRARSAP